MFAPCSSSSTSLLVVINIDTLIYCRGDVIGGDVIIFGFWISGHSLARPATQTYVDLPFWLPEQVQIVADASWTP